MMHWGYTCNAQKFSWHITMTTTLKLMHSRSDTSENSEWPTDWPSDGNDTDKSDGVVVLGSGETDTTDNVLNTVAQEQRNNEGTEITEEVIDLTQDECDLTQDECDLTQDENGDIVRPFVMDVRSKKENFSSCYEEGNSRNSCDAHAQINCDPNVAAASERLIHEKKYFPDLNTAIATFQKHSELLGCPHVRVRDVCTTTDTL